MKSLKEDVINTRLLPEQAALWYLGQEGFLIKNADSYILIDPYLSDYVDRNCSERVKWKRLYPAPISPSELDFIDLVICTHEHYDHADPDTLSALAKASPKAKFIAPKPILNTIESYGIEKERLISATADEKIIFKGSEITPIPAAHEVLHTDKEGNYTELGYIIENGCGRFFHAGDMCLYEGLEEHLTDIDVALLPINGRDYYRNSLDIIGNFTAEEAILLANHIGAKMIIPMHYDLYEVNRVSETAFINALERLSPTLKHHAFIPGEKYVYTK